MYRCEPLLLPDVGLDLDRLREGARNSWSLGCSCALSPSRSRTSLASNNDSHIRSCRAMLAANEAALHLEQNLLGCVLLLSPQSILLLR